MRISVPDATNPHRHRWLRKNSQRVIPKGWVCPRSLLFLGLGEEKQIPRFARDDKKALFPQPLKPVLPNTLPPESDDDLQIQYVAGILAPMRDVRLLFFLQNKNRKNRWRES